jgi:protein TonB
MNRIVILLLAAVLVGGCATSGRPPEVLSAGGIVYPEIAREKKLEGYVLVAYDVTVEGLVVNPRVVEAQPPGVFDAAALAAVRGWRFNPAVRNGKPVDAHGLASRVNFKLGESEGYAR